jgi:lysine-specific demethylase 8
MSTSQPVNALDRKDFSDAHFFGLEPVLITSGLEEDWPAMRKWSPETLRDMNLQNEVNLNISQNGSFKLNANGLPADAANHKVVKNISFSKAIDAILEAGENGLKYYVSHQNITKKLPKLLPDIQIWHRTLVGGPNLWLGSAGVETQLHYDEGINIFAQIYGTKKFVVYPPGESHKLYPHQSGSTLSRVDFNNPDLEVFPKFGDAKELVITVGAGEILLLPPFWWHYVESQSISISVNQWFAPALHQLIGSEALKWLV